jgi:hypothetical protein
VLCDLCGRKLFTTKIAKVVQRIILISTSEVIPNGVRDLARAEIVADARQIPRPAGLGMTSDSL